MGDETPHIVEYELFFRPDDSLQLAIFTMRYEWDEGRWNGVCQELGTATYDTDRNRLRDELVELVLHELNSLEADGERERFFERHGIEILSAPRHILQRAQEVFGQPTSEPTPWIPQRVGDFAAARTSRGL